MEFTLASIRQNDENVATIRIEGRLWPISLAALHLGMDAVPSSLVEIFKDWSRFDDDLQRIAEAIGAGRVPGLFVEAGLAEVSIPLEYPRKVFCTGANYADHLAEMGATLEKVEGRAPFFFMKPPTTCLTGPGKTVHIPAGCRDFDWEIEVVIVFGRGGRNIPLDAAMDHVAGYTLGIDFTARDQFVAPHLPFKFDFALGKCQDRTCPIGPVIVPKQFVDLANLRFSLSVNGVVKQSGCTSNMIYSLSEQIAGISQAVEIEAGDILFTGSPAGIGAVTGEFLSIGDRVVVESALTGPMEVIIQPPLA